MTAAQVRADDRVGNGPPVVLLHGGGRYGLVDVAPKMEAADGVADVPATAMLEFVGRY